MQLREEIRTANTYECPVNDWVCKFFDNGGCSLKNKEKCSKWNNYDRNNKKVDQQKYHL